MQNRIAAVTGAAGGMGRAIVAQLLADGLHVAGLDLDEAKLDVMAQKQGNRFLPCPVDLTKPDQVAQAFERVDAAYGGLDVLVNNACTCFMSEFPNVPVE